MDEFQTLPRLANQWGVSLDVLRKFLRRNPDLLKGGVVVGAARTYPPETAARIKKAFENRLHAGEGTANVA